MIIQLLVDALIFTLDLAGVSVLARRCSPRVREASSEIDFIVRRVRSVSLVAGFLIET